MIHRVLYDTSMGFTLSLYSGIPQDCRLMYKTLALTPSVELTGLFFSYHRDPTVRAGFDQKPSYYSAGMGLFHAMQPAEAEKSKKTLFRRLKRALRRVKEEKRNFRLKELDKEIMFESIWRQNFSKSLSPADRELVRGTRFVFSDIALDDMIDPATNPRRRKPNLDTGGYDFAIFQDSRIVEVSKGTTKIVRYHDALPLLASDTFQDRRIVEFHYNAIQQCAADSFFVCNSEASREQIVLLFPQLKSKAFTVPYALPDLSSWMEEDVPLRDIILARANFVSIKSAAAREDALNILRKQTAERNSWNYIVMVSTLEPRKNFSSAIRAWEKLRKTDPNLQFIIVGRPGWKFKDTLNSMAPKVATGQLIHLTDLNFAELLTVYRNARAMVFPSFGEGFGLTPMEALQCRTPSVVSDIPAHRWVMGDSVLYCDPYDVDDIAGKLHSLLYASDAQTVRERLMRHRDVTLSRYTPATVSAQWAALFDRLKKEA